MTQAKIAYEAYADGQEWLLLEWEELTPTEQGVWEKVALALSYEKQLEYMDKEGSKAFMGLGVLLRMLKRLQDGECHLVSFLASREHKVEEGYFGGTKFIPGNTRYEIVLSTKEDDDEDEDGKYDE